MSGRSYEFVQLDVFTQTPLAGNPLAIFTDARGLDDGEMQALAREMNLSETTFILPRDAPVRFTANSENAGRYRVDGQVFGEMRQRDPEFGTGLSREEVARVIGIAVDEIPAEWPIQPVSTGLTFTIVPFGNQQTLSNLKFSYAHAAEFLKNTGANLFYFLCPERR
jgi:trans-2,3-dihydro-3-hydroxyanthranilate isomerase